MTIDEQIRELGARFDASARHAEIERRMASAVRRLVELRDGTDDGEVAA